MRVAKVVDLVPTDVEKGVVLVLERHQSQALEITLHIHGLKKFRERKVRAGRLYLR